MPSDWTEETIGSFAVVKGGKRMPAGTALIPNKTSHPYLRIVDFRDGGIDKSGLMYVPEAVFPQIARYVITHHDVYISIVGTIGLVGQIPESLDGANLTENAAKITSVHARVHPKFLAYFLRSQEGQHRISTKVVGSTQPKLALFRIEEIKVPVPPLIEQAEMLAVLGALDDKIALLRETNATLEAIAQALFKSWFVDFDPVRAKAEGRDPVGVPPEVADLFPSEFEDSELGEIPKGWKVGTLQDLLVLQRGFDLPAQARTPGKYPIIAASGPCGTHMEAMARGPGVVTGRSGVLGKVFLELEDYWPLNTTLWVKEFKAATPCYAYEVLKRLDFQSYNAGSAVPTLNRNHIHGLAYLVPNQGCMHAFEEIASLLHQRVRANDKQAASLVVLRDTLLPRLMSGKLRIPESQEAFDEATA
jgi:type I restriction enzyme S subunit